jgi:hypothetical protein
MKSFEVWSSPTLGECRFANPKSSSIFARDEDLVVRSASVNTEHNSLLERAGEDRKKKRVFVETWLEA